MKITKTNIKKFVIILFILICLNIMFFCIGKLISWQLENKKAQDASDKAIETIEKVESLNIPKLKKINSDTVGWIQVKGTNINYPVVQTNNNDYYLDHDYNKAKNTAGWIFMDYRNDPLLSNKNTIIYGHGRLSKIMFGTLKNILNSDWYKNKNNYYVRYYTNKTKNIWEVFSVYRIKTTSDYIQVSFSSDDEYIRFLRKLQKRSAYDFNTYLTKEDKIITLSTCYNKKEKVVMHAKLVSSTKPN